jgi:hypothetical protein
MGVEWTVLRDINPSADVYPPEPGHRQKKELK